MDSMKINGFSKLLVVEGVIEIGTDLYLERWRILTETMNFPRVPHYATLLEMDVYLTPTKTFSKQAVSENNLKKMLYLILSEEISLKIMALTLKPWENIRVRRNKYSYSTNLTAANGYT